MAPPRPARIRLGRPAKRHDRTDRPPIHRPLRPERQSPPPQRRLFNHRSAAAVGIAAHEAGHALQDAHRYAPLVIRNFAVPAAQFGSGIGIVLLMLGAGLAFRGVAAGTPLIWLGIAGFACVAAFQLINLPVEFDASNREAVACLAWHRRQSRDGLRQQRPERRRVDLRRRDAAISPDGPLLRHAVHRRQPQPIKNDRQIIPSALSPRRSSRGFAAWNMPLSLIAGQAAFGQPLSSLCVELTNSVPPQHHH